jgi:hypothetical protein
VPQQVEGGERDGASGVGRGCADPAEVGEATTAEHGVALVAGVAALVALLVASTDVDALT